MKGERYVTAPFDRRFERLIDVVFADESGARVFRRDVELVDLR